MEDMIDLMLILADCPVGEQVNTINDQYPLVEDHSPQLLLALLVFIDPIEMRNIIN
jgi:hypothetical protein